MSCLLNLIFFLLALTSSQSSPIHPTLKPRQHSIENPANDGGSLGKVEVRLETKRKCSTLPGNGASSSSEPDVTDSPNDHQFHSRREVVATNPLATTIKMIIDHVVPHYRKFQQVSLKLME